jgi:hypothetical protein
MIVTSYEITIRYSPSLTHCLTLITRFFCLFVTHEFHVSKMCSTILIFSSEKWMIEYFLKNKYYHRYFMVFYDYDCSLIQTTHVRGVSSVFFLMTTQRVIETEYDLLVRWCNHFSILSGSISTRWIWWKIIEQKRKLRFIQFNTRHILP